MNDQSLPPAATTRGTEPTERLSLLWLYGLVAVPILTDIIETGALPQSPRAWVTEVVAGSVIAALVRQVRKEHMAVLALARTDGLTGLWNRRAFEEAIGDECVRARRMRQPLSLVCIDVDNFKQVNDKEGHGRGDQMLQQLAIAIGRAARTHIDRGFRIGGDEFALLLPGSTAAAAQAVVMRLREHCALADRLWASGPLGLSAGIVELDAQETTAEFARRADAAMYAKKAARRS